VLGYQLHIDTEMGLQYLSSSIVLVGYAFSQLMTLAALGMLIQGRRHPHLTAMLALLIMPTMIFYCCYDAVGASAVRLMTLPLSAMMCAAVLIFHNTGESRRDLVLPVAAMVVAAMCIPGTAYLAYLIEVPVWATPAIGMAFAAVSALWRRDWRYTIFFLVVAAGYHATTFAFLSIVCAWTVISAIRARFRSA
jgi:hypothetical protein